MRKTILFFPFNLLSHYLRCLVLAQRYDHNQYRICFVQSKDFDHFVIQAGYETFPCAQFDAAEVLQCAQRFDFSWMNHNQLEKIMLAQVAAIKSEGAAMVIGDMAPTLKMAAAATGVVYISLLNGYMTRYYARTRKISRTHKAYWIINRLPEALSSSMTRMGEQLLFRQIQRPFNKLREKYGLLPCNDYLEELEGEETLICDLQSLFPQKTLPSSYQVIGPLIYHSGEANLHFLQPPLERPLICVCMGSSGDWNRLKFLNHPYYSRYTIVAAGDQNQVLNASHIIQRDFVNLNQLLKMCSLLICHGGNGTMYHGILNQVFMLCLSNHFEQEWNIDALEQQGYGLSADDFDEASWKQHITACCTYSDTQWGSIRLPS